MNTLRIRSDHFDLLKNKLFQYAPKEAVAFGVGAIFENKKGSHFVVRDIKFPKKDDYIIQEQLQLKVSPIFLNRMISEAERQGLTVISFHTHPFSKNDIWFSEADDYGDSITARTINDCLGKPYASMVLGQNNAKARIWLSSKKVIELPQIRIIGNNINYLYDKNSKVDSSMIDHEKYSRQIKAFGKAGQAVLSNLKIGIVGLGGTGSCVAEQLARQGVKDFILIDHDHIEESNKTRIYGSYHNSTGNKVEIAKDNLISINPSVKIQTVCENVMSGKAAKLLSECDFIFSCLDRHAPRSILNEIAYHYYIPIIDMGAGLSTKGSKVKGGSVRATLIGPGLPCLFCWQYIKPEVISAESLSKEERKKQFSEGYVPGLDEEPSVINFTSMAASMAVTIFLDALFSFSDKGRRNILFTLDNFETLNYQIGQNQNCVCSAREAYGDYKSLSI